MTIEKQLLQLYTSFHHARLSRDLVEEAKKRVLDTLGCFAGAFHLKPVALLRNEMVIPARGAVSVWGTKQKAPPDLAAWANGTAVRAMDFNDTYLSKEPCHPSDLIPSIWAACELSGGREGLKLIKGLILGYEVMGRLCDARSLRLRGWDHVTYLPIASAMACSSVLGLKPDQCKNAISLSITGNNAMRQTRVGEISDWKAACAAYAARSGLWAAMLAKKGFTGPSHIFEGRHGFFNQVSGPFKLSKQKVGADWMLLRSHTKFFPAEHHSQSAIEAALLLRPHIKKKILRRVDIDTFDVSVDIIGSEPEKWAPRTRETADHSMPYLVAVALLDGTVSLRQYEKKRYLDRDIRSLLKRVRVRRSKRYSRLYPKHLPNRVTVTTANGDTFSQEVLLPKGYAGNPMSWNDVIHKFKSLTKGKLRPTQIDKIVREVSRLDRLSSLGLITKHLTRSPFPSLQGRARVGYR